MRKRERILVTMTSWHKRIGNVEAVVKTLLNQTLPADKIILNFCIQDFPNLEEDFPETLRSLIEEHPQIETYWYIENYKAWKKHLHAIEIAGDDDLILSTDDDHLYPSDFIEKMYVSYCYYGKQHPVTLNRILLMHNCWCFNGPGMLYKKSHLPKDYKRYLVKDVMLSFEDIILSALLALNGSYCLPEIFYMPLDGEMLYNDIYSFSDNTAIIRNANEVSDHDVSNITNVSRHTLSTVVKVFDEHYFNRYVPKPGEDVFIPKFWKFHADVISKIREKEKTSYITLPEKYLLDKFEELPLTGNIMIPHSELKDVLKINMHRYDKNYYIGEGNKLVITLSSWNKRIGNCYKVISDMLYNTFTPDEIVLNLAKPDFGVPVDKNPDLYELVQNGVFPKDLYELIKDNSIIRVHWYDDAGYRSWKKYIHVSQHYKPNDVIIAIDDDVLYKETFIETMVKSYYEYGRKHPISSIRSFCQGGIGICGYAFLFTPKFITFGPELYSKDILYKFPEDNHILNVVNFNGYPVMPVIGYNFLFYSTSFNQGDESNFGNMVFTDDWWKSYCDLIEESGRIIQIAGKGREELRMGWNPVYFNFNTAEIIKYLENNNRETLSEPVKHVYDTMKLYLEKYAGTNVVVNDLPQKIDSTIL